MESNSKRKEKQEVVTLGYQWGKKLPYPTMEPSRNCREEAAEKAFWGRGVT